jgi:hypothetical protein
MALTPPATSETKIRHGACGLAQSYHPPEVMAAAGPFELLVHEHEQWIPAWLPYSPPAGQAPPYVSRPSVAELDIP